MKILMTRFRNGSLGHYIYDELESLNTPILPIDVDVFWGDITDEGLLKAEEMSLYDRVINLAGITLNQPINEFNMADSIKVINVNMLGAMNITSKYSHHTEPRAIFHIGSIGGRKVMTNCSVYSASKAGLDHYVHCAAYEGKKNNMAVISVDPPNLLGTPMTRKVQDGLINNRGMSKDMVDKIYADAADPRHVAAIIVQMVLQPYQQLELLSGENIVLGKSDHR
jgi:NAD(P)-dependent dehydrogenase (short-subunit alcohol dehydrogenase family)